MCMAGFPCGISYKESSRLLSYFSAAGEGTRRKSERECEHQSDLLPSQWGSKTRRHFLFLAQVLSKLGECTELITGVIVEQTE